ncbi:hypothetical protein BDZ91DRAFT_712790 [Kalaharituber pfeilii]|nr:hypothetical protein BDZ91DRAFT_712790 [Kalaharituber pfeilii]
MCEDEVQVYCCNHFSTHRTMRCYPRGRSSQCVGRSVTSYVQSNGLCPNCTARGYRIRRVSVPAAPAASMQLPAAAANLGYPWSVGGVHMYPGGAIFVDDRGIHWDSTPAAPPRPSPPTLSHSPPSPPASPVGWGRFMERTPVALATLPPPPSPPAPTELTIRGWERYLNRTPAQSAAAPPPLPQTPAPSPPVGPTGWSRFTGSETSTPVEPVGWGRYSGGAHPPSPPDAPKPTSATGWGRFTGANATVASGGWGPLMEGAGTGARARGA